MSFLGNGKLLDDVHLKHLLAACDLFLKMLNIAILFGFIALT